tara:strand:- start:52 stop:723 length:672 start_codon:yes stop_codon:yes gene_type:complete
MSVTLDIGWFSEALIGIVDEHYTPATLIVENNLIRVMTFPFTQNSICVKSITVSTSQNMCIFISKTIRQFVKQCHNMFSTITLKLDQKDVIISCENETQALKYRLPIITTPVVDILRTEDDIELELVGSGFLQSWKLFKETVTISCFAGQKTVKMECNTTLKLVTLFSCQTAAKKGISFTCEADSMKILDFLSQNENISVVFMSNGVFAVHTSCDKVFIAPPQ